MTHAAENRGDERFKRALRRLLQSFSSTANRPFELRLCVERVTGIEPAWPAWKAGALPLSYTRVHPRVPGQGTGSPGCLHSARHGVWRSLVAHPLWERGAVGSNPATPTVWNRL